MNDLWSGFGGGRRSASAREDCGSDLVKELLFRAVDGRVLDWEPLGPDSVGDAFDDRLQRVDVVLMCDAEIFLGGRGAGGGALGDACGVADLRGDIEDLPGQDLPPGRA
ncbi:hypothetical protein ACFW9I_31080 [[Kitasatospora] papulosa]|uniref:hypothetical protein n=1 Tax=[Kitasatospora] papulosa TaxID=1464011 RepID=UPI003691FAEE